MLHGLVRMAYRLSVVLLICLLAGIRPGIASADLTSTVKFDIAPQQMPSALLKYSEQSGVQVTSSGEAIEGKSSAGVVGTFVARGALDKLLAGTQLAYEVVDSNTVAIRAPVVSPPSRPATAPAAAAVKSEARSATASTSETGKRGFWDRFRLAQVDGASSSTAGVAGKEIQSGAEPSEAREVVVTGTRRADITVAESSTPIDVISSERIARQGFTDTNDLLRTTVPSLNAKTFSVDSFAVAIRPFSLRGLSPDQTLVLVNGKRRHRSAIVQLSRLPLSSGSQGPDLSTIPSIAIERVEVLRDGAAAQYGSDAIAGVVNFQLKRTREGGEVGVKSGQYYTGDGETYQAQGNLGLPLFSEGFVNLSAEYARSEHTQRGRQRADAAALIAAGNTAIANPAQLVGEPSNESESVFVNSELPFGETATGYLFANYANHEVEAGQFYRNPDPNGARRDIFASVPLTTTPGGARFTFASLFPGGLLPIATYHVKDSSATTGVKGTLAGGLKYDFSGSLARSWSINGIYDTVNPSLGPTAPTKYFTSLQQQRETQAHADFVYDWSLGAFAKPLSVAFGAEYREESFELGAGDPDSYRAGPFARVLDPDTGAFVGLAIGSSAAPGTAPSQAGTWSRSNSAVYLDLETDVVDRFSVGLAGRYEDFSDFGGTFNYKISARYAVVDWLAFRGSYNTGFRAPTPGQSHISAQSTSIDPATGALRLIATVPVDSPVAAYYGARELQPEESKNYSLGTVLQSSGGLLFTLDYFHIEITDRLGVTSNINISAADRVALAAQGIDTSGLNAVAFFANAFDTRTQGFDAVLSRSWALGAYRVGLNAALNHTKTEVTKVSFRPAIDREREIEIGSYYPKWRTTLASTVERGPWSLATTLSYYGKYTDAVAAVSATSFDQTYGSEVLVDLEVGYDINDRFRITGGGSNILGTYPGKEGLAGNKNNGFIYTQNSPYGYNGGFYYLRGTFRF